jgi:hypothetical protein
MASRGDPTLATTPRRTLGVFVKRPAAGKVKTRLGAVIGMEPAARLYEAFVGDVLEATLGVVSIRRVVFYATEDLGEDRDPNPELRFQTLISDLGMPSAQFAIEPQHGENLGERMHNAFVRLLGSPDWGGDAPAEPPSRAAVLIGSDLPTLRASTLDRAFEALERVDLVLGPALDGGYYLIGMHRPWADLFHGVPWSSSVVLASTLERARRLELRVEILEAARDIDTWDDLLALEDEILRSPPSPSPPSRTASLLRRLFGGGFATGVSGPPGDPIRR